MIQFSFIIPVYNRPHEIKELLESFKALTTSDAFEIVIIEDGSTLCCSEIVTNYKDVLDISYYQKPNTGPGDSRNFGMGLAKGNYFIILDSDVLLPPDYLEQVSTFLKHSYVDCFGGADAAHDSFTNLQKAINYTMTSFLTTGGIRGSKKAVQHFEPRSFNMGLSKVAFEATLGFAKIHPGEDPDLSHRIIKAGFQTSFVPDIAVFHKRRVSWSSFMLQVKKFGLVRPILNKWHPQGAKITFWLPTLFVLFTLASMLLGIIYGWLFLLPLVSYMAVIFADASLKTKSIAVGFMAILAMFIQFFGYGYGFLKATIFIHWLEKDPQKQFPRLFFK
jgi:glycosyltransferase involved in cell wall biosynthesis|tara:strand:+ start:51 stop:1049 length:999 start_codon:yes stop_codon:yes gene_type:complete